MARYRYAIFLLFSLSYCFGVVITANSKQISPYVVCPDGEFVFIPAENCNQFYLCTDGAATTLDCAPGENFNPDTGFCDPNYECQSETTTEGQAPDTTTITSTSSTSTATATTANPIGPTNGFLQVLMPDVPCPPQGFAYKIHPTYCNYFYYCREGEEILQQCAFLYRFDTVQGRCLYRDQATCLAGAEKVLEVISYVGAK